MARRVVAGLVLAVSALFAFGTGPVQLRTVLEALDLYASGSFNEAVSSITSQRVGRGRLTSDAEQWIKTAGAGSSSGRALVAASFALDVVTSGAAAPNDSEVRSLYREMREPIVSWGCRLMRQQRPSPALRSWFRASIASLEDARHYAALISATGPPDMPIVDPEIKQGHLSHVLAVFPDEGRARLARVWVQDALLSDRLGSARPSSTPYLRSDEITPAVREAIASLPGGDRPSQRAESPRGQASAAIDQIPAIRRMAVAAANDPTVHAEGLLRLAHLDVRSLEWSHALAEAQDSLSSTKDPFLQYIGHLIAGWSLSRLDRRVEAIAHYRSADALVPNVRATSTLLAAELFSIGRRDEAYAVLDDLNHRDVPAPDPWIEFKNGDARLLPILIQQLREALR